MAGSDALGECLFYGLLGPAIIVGVAYQDKPKTTVGSVLLGLAGGITASAYAYEPMWHLFRSGHQWEGYNPDVGGVILESKMEAGLVCTIMTIAAITLAVILAWLVVACIEAEQKQTINNKEKQPQISSPQLPETAKGYNGASNWTSGQVCFQ